MTVVALSGGVGGAKLASGLQDILAPGELVVIANTGDDFEHLGLHIAPDIDSVFYALAGLNDTERGWGRAGETWACMAALGALGGETWFRLSCTRATAATSRSSTISSANTASRWSSASPIRARTPQHCRQLCGSCATSRP